ncbi:MAG TPA: YtxH domain-containing protein [Thermodesulfobacteriota bacterium]|nr:YtxH domain-containing protein [Deltaproteobacteria bacterium]HNR12001.1 YtxH domain-containing protein [Thermodesulfobacteriota bacterium]HNU72736.1 YtxH domain-containing protein [Thermodesulfobacteriota bacterium]HOC37897.1 YtxH domain-containing protein [Thermodesulfobacteriota bacterium]HQO78022.1 YtxH domain-containing protein [Thermodesulfobacteriota bacterium]
MSDNRSGFGFAALALSFISGGIVGAALGVLFAPRSGLETREMIKEQADEACVRIRDAADTIIERAEELAATGRGKWGDAREVVHASVERVKDSLNKKIEEAAEIDKP